MIDCRLEYLERYNSKHWTQVVETIELPSRTFFVARIKCFATVTIFNELERFMFARHSSATLKYFY